MAQGGVKKNATPNPRKEGKAGGARLQNKRGGQGAVSKPKKAKGTSADKMQKKLSAGLVARTEAMLGEKAGHLELIGKGRKKTGEKAADDKKKKLSQGGSRKFG
ncbi:hypothetical protein B0H66DRAFT_140453 [Apodospora peruviana]|uniref:Uncharacterized protein n=1 Tax=Apodospora peruviana TaxID=516989 RepID=A0AAE0MB94_9PEZI|nr:hypothetical protein B0H66DRAFT_140453 [Apodospora peruviana]